MTDQFGELMNNCIDLINWSFADPADPASVGRELYHQFRKMWDRGIPVGMGLGHLLVRSVPGYAFGIVRLGENGQPDQPIAAVTVGPTAPAEGYLYTVTLVFAPVERVPRVHAVYLNPRPPKPSSEWLSDR